MIVGKVKIYETRAKAVYVMDLPAGLKGGEIIVDFESEVWDGLIKMYVFDNHEDVKTRIGHGNTVTIREEVLTENTHLRMGVYGVDARGNIKIPTIWADLGTVYPSADPGGDPDLNPDLPIWAQILAELGDLTDLKTTDQSSLVAAINEVFGKAETNAEAILGLNKLLSGPPGYFMTYSKDRKPINRKITPGDLGMGHYVVNDAAEKKEKTATATGKEQRIQDPQEGMQIAVTFTYGNTESAPTMTLGELKNLPMETGDPQREYPALPKGFTAIMTLAKGKWILPSGAGSEEISTNPGVPPKGTRLQYTGNLIHVFDGPGQSERDLMSQKAITDLADTKMPEVKGSDRQFITFDAGGKPTARNIAMVDLASGLYVVAEAPDAPHRVLINVTSRQELEEVLRTKKAPKTAGDVSMPSFGMTAPVLFASGNISKAFDMSFFQDPNQTKYPAAVSGGGDIPTFEVPADAVGVQINCTFANGTIQLINPPAARYIVAESLYTASAPEAAVKTVVLPGGKTPETPKDNSALFIKFTDGSTADKVTLKIGGGSWKMARNPWRYSDLAADCPVGEIPAGHTIMVHLDGQYAFWQDCGYRPLISMAEEQFGWDMIKLVNGERQETKLTPKQVKLAEEIENKIAQIGGVFVYFKTYDTLIELSDFNSQATYFRFHAIDKLREFSFQYTRKNQTVSAYMDAMARKVDSVMTIRTTKDTGSPELYQAPTATLEKYASIGTPTPWYNKEIPGADIAKMSVGQAVRLLVHDSDRNKDLYLLGIVRKVNGSANCEIEGAGADGLSTAAIDDTQTSTETTYSSLHGNTVYANALIRTVQGEAISVDDVSPLEHEVKCTVSGVPDLSKVTVSRYGRNLLNLADCTDFYNCKLEGGKVRASIINSTFCQFVLPTDVSKTFKPGVSYHFVMNTNPLGKTMSVLVSGGGYFKEFAGGTTVDFQMDSSFQQADSIRIRFNRAPDRFTDTDSLFDDFNLTIGEKPFEPYRPFQALAPTPSGLVSGMTSLSPNMTVLTDTPGALLDVSYNQDSMAIIKKLSDRIATLENNAVKEI